MFKWWYIVLTDQPKWLIQTIEQKGCEQMTNTELLTCRIRGSGKTFGDCADYLGISRQAFSYKVKNRREFKASEIEKLCSFLHINTKSEQAAIFFAQQIAKMAN